MRSPSQKITHPNHNLDLEIMTVSPELLTGLGSAASIFFTSMGAALASAHAGTYAIRGHSGFRDFCPIIVSGVLAIYGIIVSVLLVGKLTEGTLSEVDGYRNLSAGLAVGLACLASGIGLSKFLKQCNEGTIVGSRSSAGLAEPLVGSQRRAEIRQPSIVKLCLCLSFLEAIGLYGLIVALFLMG